MVLPLQQTFLLRSAPGIGNVLGNKGGVGVRLSYLTVDRPVRLLLVCCHLAAHEDQVAARNLGFHRIAAGLFRDKQASASYNAHAGCSQLEVCDAAVNASR